MSIETAVVVRDEQTPEAINLETGEVTPAAEPSPSSPTRDPYVGAAVQPFDAATQAVLARAIPVEDIDILPTGEIYASQVRYRRILNEAFGVGGWALIPRGELRLNPKDSYMYQKWALYAHGRFISEAIGEQEYQEDNKRMSYAAAAEGAKSNALTRCCKDLGIASECWDKHFANKFVADYCVQVWRSKSKTGKPEWRRADSPPFYDETGTVKGERVDRSTSQERPLATPQQDVDPADSFRASSDNLVTEAQALSITQWCRTYAVDFKAVFGRWFSVDKPEQMTEPQYIKWLEIRDDRLVEVQRASLSKDIPKAEKIVEQAMDNVRAQNPANAALISEAQGKRLYAIARGNGALLKSILADCGFAHSRDIPKARYDQVVAAVQKAVNV